MNRVLAGLACAGLLLSSGLARAQAPEPISIVVFGPPSLGAFLPPVIKAQKLDEKNGLAIKFEERTPDAYTAQFNSGEFQLGGSASLLTVGLADIRGVKVTYLFNLFDFWGAVVTSRPEVKTLKDLEGKDLAAAKGTTNYVMFDWFARQLGADTAKFSVINTATPGLIGYALADRAAAVQLWEPAYTTLLSKKPGMRTIDLAIADSWKKFTGSRNIPYLGVAAHVSWVEKNPKLVAKLYAAYKEAADWVTAHPDEASKLIATKGTADDQKAIADLIRANDRLGMNVKWASDVAKEINSVYAAGKSIAFLPSDPAASTIYQAPGPMSDAAPQIVTPRDNTLLAAAKRLGTSVLPFVVVILVWQFASLFFPRFLFPSLIDVFWRCIDIFSSGAMFGDVLATILRILAGLAGAFIVGGGLALLMVRSRAVDNFLSPILTLFQGIPALSWVVFAIIWFHGVEFRIFFIMVMTTLPAFTFQVLGALRAMSRDLMEMVFSFRPTRAKLFRVMIAPAILPDILTAWKVNLGNASRVVVVAELVGATGGVGYQLLQQQQLFDMAGALAWTLQLVFFVLIVQGALTLIENVAFRYRAVSERAI